MLFLSTAVTLAAIAIARPPKANVSWFYASLLFISAGAVGAFVSVDAFFYYMFHELALVPTFLLIGIWGSGIARRRRGRSRCTLPLAASSCWSA